MERPQDVSGPGFQMEGKASYSSARAVAGFRLTSTQS